ncbi:unnamed protein product, partial [Rangifer tarandus platyrhynchus]
PFLGRINMSDMMDPVPVSPTACSLSSLPPRECSACHLQLSRKRRQSCLHITGCCCSATRGPHAGHRFSQEETVGGKGPGARPLRTDFLSSCSRREEMLHSLPWRAKGSMFCLGPKRQCCCGAGARGCPVGCGTSPVLAHRPLWAGGSPEACSSFCRGGSGAVEERALPIAQTPESSFSEVISELSRLLPSGLGQGSLWAGAPWFPLSSPRQAGCSCVLYFQGLTSNAWERGCSVGSGGLIHPGSRRRKPGTSLGHTYTLRCGRESEPRPEDLAGPRSSSQSRVTSGESLGCSEPGFTHACPGPRFLWMEGADWALGPSPFQARTTWLVPPSRQEEGTLGRDAQTLSTKNYARNSVPLVLASRKMWPRCRVNSWAGGLRPERRSRQHRRGRSAACLPHACPLCRRSVSGAMNRSRGPSPPRRERGRPGLC